MKIPSVRSQYTFGILTTPTKDIFHSNYHLGLLAGICPRIKALKGQLKIVMMPAKPHFPSKKLKVNGTSPGNPLGKNDKSQDKPYKSLQEILTKNGLDGLLILTWRWIHPSIAKLIETTAHSRVLVVNDPVPGLQVNIVSTDTNAGMAQTVAHLIRKGRRKIGMLHGPTKVPFKIKGKEILVPFIDTRLKEEGFLKALKAKRLVVNKKWIRSGAANTEAEGFSVMTKWLREKDLPEAIVCGNDDLAFGVVRALKKAGKRVPQEVAVIGFDDNERAKSFSPPLTTVRQPLAQMGKDAVDILIRKIRRPASRPEAKRYIPKLIARKTA